MSNRLEVKIKRIHPDAIIPTYSTRGSAGADLYSIEDYNLEPSERKLFHTGIQIEIPFGYEGQIRPRSGLALNHGLIIINTPGTIDSDYRGEIGIILLNTDKENSYEVIKRERIAQMLIKRVEQVKFTEVNELSETKRGTGGFGHSRE